VKHVAPRYRFGGAACVENRVNPGFVHVQNRVVAEGGSSVNGLTVGQCPGRYLVVSFVLNQVLDAGAVGLWVVLVSY